MKVVLPSNGILGRSVATLRQPTYGDIRALTEESDEHEILNQFIKSLVKTDFSKITYWDLYYMMTIVVFQMSFNNVKTDIKCKCGESFSDNVTLDAYPLILFEGKKVYKNKVQGVPCKFTPLSAQNHFDAVEYAIQQEDYDTAYQAAVACFILGHSLDEIKSIPYVQLAAANLYHKASFHGANVVKSTVCPHCGKKINVRFTITAKSVTLQLNQIIGRYVNVSDVASFDDFLKMTIPEYHALIQALNAGM